MLGAGEEDCNLKLWINLSLIFTFTYHGCTKTHGEVFISLLTNNLITMPFVKHDMLLIPCFGVWK